jgi:hypothetical protein
MTKNVCWSSCKLPVILVRFLVNLNFLGIVSKNIQLSNFMKIRPAEVESFRTHGHTDSHDAANRRFSQFCKASILAVAPILGACR